MQNPQQQLKERLKVLQSLYDFANRQIRKLEKEKQILITNPCGKTAMMIKTEFELLNKGQ